MCTCNPPPYSILKSSQDTIPKKTMPISQPSLLPKFLQSEELTQECKDLISTLPKEKGWGHNHLYQFQGFWYSSMPLQAMLSCQKHFEARDQDIILVTTPKSGTTWLKALAFALLNRKRYVPNLQDHPLLTSNPHSLVRFLELDLYIKKDTIPHDLNSIPSPRLFATHIPYVSLPKSVKENSNCKIVYLCRDPKDTFVSLWHFTRTFLPENTLEDCFDKFCRGVNIYGPFWEHVLGYWKQSLERTDKVMFLRYEELKSKPDLVLKELAEFMGCPFSEQELYEGTVDDILKLCSFENLSKLEVNNTGKRPTGVEHKAFFRRGEIGDWKNHLTIEMAEQLNKVVEKKLVEHGLRF